MSQIHPIISALLFIVFLNTLSKLNAQTTCWDLSPYDNNYLNTISLDDTTYPPGSVIFQTGHIRIIKPNTGNSYMSINGDTLCYIGKIEMNVATAPFAQRRLTFSYYIINGLVIDGDTVFNNFNPPALYNGNGFTLTHANNIFTISGTFNSAHIFGSTNCLHAVCLSPETTPSQICLDFSSLTPQNLNDISMDNTTYPPGSVIAQTGHIRLIKPSIGNSYMSVNGDTICYIGKIEMNVATAPYAQRRLRFSSYITYGLVIDGDTIFNNSNPPALYNGAGFTLNYANNDFIITGAFDTVHIFGSTNCLHAICLEEISSTPQTCLDLSSLTPQNLNDISMDNTTYPPGSVIAQTGHIRLIKPSIGNSYMSVNGDTLCYIGEIEMNVATAPYAQRRLRFSSYITYGLVIDGDTIFNNSNPPALYNGAGFTLNYANNDFIITGAFDTVHIFGSTNCLHAICLEDISTHLQPDFENNIEIFHIYPNPSEGLFTLKHTFPESVSLQVYSIQGNLLYRKDSVHSEYTLDLQTFPSGIYLIKGQTEKGFSKTYRIHIQR